MKTKFFWIGIILGIFIGSTIPAIAQQVYEAYTNSFPVYVDGEQKDINGYNINGNTYFKLRDLGSFIGFGVDFKEGNILIETLKDNNSIDLEYNNNLTDSDVNAYISTIDDMLKNVKPDMGLMKDGEQYGYCYTDLNLILNNISISGEDMLVDDEVVYYLQLINKSGDVVVEKLNSIMINSKLCLAPDYFVTTILPLDN